MNLMLVFLVLSVYLGLGESQKYENHNKTPLRSNATPKATFHPPVPYNTQPYAISIPIMIHLDQILTGNRTKGYRSKNTRRNTRIYFRNILKNVEKIYSHPSLNQTLKITLLNVKILNNATKRIKIDDNVSNYLSSFCQWQGSIKRFKGKWYYSVLFTGLDLYNIDGRRRKNWTSTARGYLRGICSLRHSCSVLEWDTTHVAYMLAHEMAHSLGLPHDGHPFNTCQFQRHIMAEKLNKRHPADSWSACSRRYLDVFLRSDKSWCLRAENRNHLWD